jgi:hypothetical protein
MFPRIRRRSPVALLLASVVGLTCLVVPGGATAAPALGAVVSTNPVNWTPHVSNGAVYKFVQASNGLIYAGGSFTEVTAAPGIQPGIVFKRNNLVAFNPTTGLVHGFRPSFNGPVWALATDGTSLYVGGEFTTVNGQPRSRLAKFNLATGALDSNFRPGLQDMVRDAVFVNGRLIVSGRFNKKIASMNTSSGWTTSYLNIPITGSVADNAGPTEVYRFAVNPAGTRLVGVGNFTSVGGSTRYRALMLNLGSTSVSVNPWEYVPLRNRCRSTSATDYLRDVDFSPDGSWFVIVSTGWVPQAGGVGRDICDAAARFETSIPAPNRPTWINYTGGDTLHSVAATDVAVYVQGHQRWLNNPQGVDFAGPGAVSRPGIGAINPTTGLALSWNPTKDMGVGGRDLYVTSQGLWVGSDTVHIGGEIHPRIALMPR